VEGPDEVVQLRNSIRALSRDVRGHLVLTDLPFVQSIGGCRLTMTCGDGDAGVVDRARPDFEWILRAESWLGVDEQLEPFCVHQSSVSFQYLNPGTGPEVIYSTARAW
jgi:hypothetical protein